MKKWYYKIENQEYGAVTQEELLNLIHLEKITKDTLIKDEEMSIWVKASSIDGLIPIEKESKTQYSSKGAYLFFLLLSTVWIIYNNIPYLPLGAILAFVFVRVKNRKYYTPFVLATIMGFIGTGGYFSISTLQRTMIKTGETHNVHRFNMGIRFGFNTLYYLQNKDKIVIYKDSRVANQVAVATKVMEQFVKSYNQDSADFLLKSFSKFPNFDEDKTKEFLRQIRNQHGDINSFEHIGDMAVYTQKQPIFAVFYKIKTTKDQSRAVRLLFIVSQEKQTLTFAKIGFLPKEIEFRVIKTP
jgi:hypothetical protein